MTRYTPHFSIDRDGTVRQHLPLLRSFAMHDPHGILRDPYSLAQTQLGGIKMHETEIEPGDVERMARLLTLAAGVDPEAMDPLVTRMDPPARKWERYANQARALLTERDLAEEMAEVLEATDPEPCCEPEPSDWWLTDQWVLVDGEHPKYIKSGMVYHSKFEASKGTADAVHGPNSTLAAIRAGRMVPLSSALGQDTTQALTVTPGMLDVAARAYFYATTLSPSGEDGEDDWSTRVPRRVKNYIRDGLVAALDALEEHRMVETDYVHGQTMSAGLAVTDEQVDLIEGQPYRVVDHGVVSIGTWDSKSLRFVTSRTGSGEPRTWAPLREVSEVTPLTPGVITDGLVDGVSQTYRQAYGAKKSAGPDYRPRDERLKQAAEAVLTHLGYRREQA